MTNEPKTRWTFLVEDTAKNMEALNNHMLSEDCSLWEIPNGSVIGILKVEGDDGQ